MRFRDSLPFCARLLFARLAKTEVSTNKLSTRPPQLL